MSDRASFSRSLCSYFPWLLLLLLPRVQAKQRRFEKKLGLWTLKRKTSLAFELTNSKSIPNLRLCCVEGNEDKREVKKERKERANQHAVLVCVFLAYALEFF